MPYTELSCHGRAVAVKTDIHANRLAVWTSALKACIRGSQQDMTWVPCSRSTAVRDDSFHMGGRDCDRQDFLPGSMHLCLAQFV